MRMIAALLVLVSHQFALSGRPEPRFVGEDSFGHLGVLIFFSISGYLVTSSWLKDPHVLRFVARRVLRMAPALCVSMPLTLAVIASFGMTGFPDNPRHLTNGSLWTVPYEVYCYAGLLVAGVATRRPSIALAVASFGYLVFAEMRSETNFLAYFGVFFAAGSLLRAFPIGLKPLAILVTLTIGCALIHGDQTTLGLAFMVPPLTIVMGSQSWPGLRDISAIGDLSYGVYIYAWPVQQMGVAYMGRQTPYFELLAVTVPVTLALAAASWHLIEKKALRCKPGKKSDNPTSSRAAVDP
ncbi:acyltransferase [Luteibacter sp. PPL201]|uniref:Acyltransferase n=1 Tax=Luteibacter sahnii TaxID=3021977 RepID=A0ABT6B956_9GAMM